MTILVELGATAPFLAEAGEDGTPRLTTLLQDTLAQAMEQPARQQAPDAALQPVVLQVLLVQVPGPAHRRMHVADVQLLRRGLGALGEGMRVRHHQLRPAGGRFRGMAENEGTTTNLEGRVTTLHQKVTPPGTARADWMIAAELAVRLGGDLGIGTAADLWAELVEKQNVALAIVVGAIALFAAKGANLHRPARRGPRPPGPGGRG